MMNTMGTQVMAIGNHEFDWGIDTLNTIEKEAKFDVLSCNIYDKTTGNRVTYAKPYSIITNGQGIKIGFIGVTTPRNQINNYAFNNKQS